MSAPGQTIVVGGAAPPSSGGGAAIILIMMVCLLVAGYYYYTTVYTAAAPAPSSEPVSLPPPDLTVYGPSASPAPAPAPDPKATLVATGKVLQLDEKDISVSPPTELGTSGVDTTKPVAYTISMFINIANTSGAYRNIFSRGVNDGDRKPAIFIRPNSLTFHFRHGTDNDGNFGLDATAVGATAGQYTHVAFVNDGATMSVYINGTKDANTRTIDPAHKCVWGSNDTLHAAVPPANIAAGYLKIKELYMFPTALAEADIKTLSTVSTTSTYSTEPVYMVSNYEVEPITSTAEDYRGMIE
jgi:Concanavalin A-like lectin/glucanases superfamily